MPFRVPRAEGSAGTGVVGRPARPGRRSGRVRSRWPCCPSPAVTPPQPDTGARRAGAAAPHRRSAGSARASLTGASGCGRCRFRPRSWRERLSKGHVELVDSAVTAIVQGYLDSIANDPSCARRRPCRAGRRRSRARSIGIDSKNIYIAGLKIPAAVLALLPIPAGNIDQNQRVQPSDGPAGGPAVRGAAGRESRGVQGR